METHSPLFLDVQQRLGHGRSHLPRKLSEEETAEVAYAFDKLAAGEQTVGARHVKIALRAMGFPVKKDDVSELLRDAGLHPDAPIDWRGFSEVVGGKLTTRGPQDEARRAFELFDLSRSGRISLADLTAVARQLRVEVEPAELADMISQFDTDGDGAISEEEFRAILAASRDGVPL